jgi:hypothetical protein
MTDPAELKKLVKQLQSAPSDEVIDFFYSVLFTFTHFLLLLQEIIDVLRILKKDFEVNEAVLRVSLPRVFFGLFPIPVKTG